MEVIYTGLRQTPEQIVGAALQEDADVIGMSILSGAHMHACPRVMELLKEKGLDDVLVVVGGIIPDVDIPKLQAMGVKGIFLPGSPMQQIIEFITANVRPRAAERSVRSLEPRGRLSPRRRGSWPCPVARCPSRCSSVPTCSGRRATRRPDVDGDAGDQADVEPSTSSSNSSANLHRCAGTSSLARVRNPSDGPTRTTPRGSAHQLECARAAAPVRSRA